MATTVNISDVMISYSRRDIQFVRQLDQALRKVVSEIWVDWEDILPSVDWWAEIKSGIDGSNVVVFVLTPSSVNSEVCRQELDHAVAKNKRIIPLVHIDITDPADVAKIHPDVKKQQWIYFRKDDDFKKSFAELTFALKTNEAHTKQHTILLIRASDWDMANHPNSQLLRGNDLKSAEGWLDTGYQLEPEPLPIHVDYITRSRKHANLVRRRTVIGGLGVLIVLIALGVMGLLASVNATQEVEQQVQQAEVLATRRYQVEQQETVVIGLEATREAVVQLVGEVEATQVQQAIVATESAFSLQLTQSVLDANATAQVGVSNIQATEDAQIIAKQTQVAGVQFQVFSVQRQIDNQEVMIDTICAAIQELTQVLQIGGRNVCAG